MRRLAAAAPDPWSRSHCRCTSPPRRSWCTRPPAVSCCAGMSSTDRWLQVGGHGDPGETDPLAIALREAREETGLTDLVPWPDATPAARGGLLRARRRRPSPSTSTPTSGTSSPPGSPDAIAPENDAVAAALAHHRRGARPGRRQQPSPTPSTGPNASSRPSPANGLRPPRTAPRVVVGGVAACSAAGGRSSPSSRCNRSGKLHACTDRTSEWLPSTLAHLPSVMIHEVASVGHIAASKTITSGNLSAECELCRKGPRVTSGA